jgi:hypothetical protein
MSSGLPLSSIDIHLWSSRPEGGADMGVKMTAMLLLLHAWPVTTHDKCKTSDWCEAVVLQYTRRDGMFSRVD